MQCDECLFHCGTSVIKFNLLILEIWSKLKNSNWRVLSDTVESANVWLQLNSLFSWLVLANKKLKTWSVVRGQKKRAQKIIHKKLDLLQQDGSGSAVRVGPVQKLNQKLL